MISCNSQLFNCNVSSIVTFNNSTTKFFIEINI